MLLPGGNEVSVKYCKRQAFQAIMDWWNIQ